jgi:hypothetical protein
MTIETRQKILSEVLELTATRFHNHVDRGAIFLPEGYNLLIRAHWGISPENVERTICYIGDDARKKQGSAGNVYLTRQQRIAHMHQAKDGLWKSDDEYFIDFSVHRRIWPYRSSALTPIFEVGPEDVVTNLRPQGVLVFNSQHETIFDSEEAKEYLRQASKRIAFLLRVYSPTLSGTR